MANQGSSPLEQTSWKARLGFALVGLLLASALVIYSTLYFGLIRGEEFSSHTFKRRHFVYYEIPLVGLQVIPITHTDKTGNLEAWLVKKKLVSVKTGKNFRWDLATARRGDAVTNVGDAQILCHYLDAIDDQDEQVWLNWTKEHRGLSRVLWPVVAGLARQELYIFIPKVFVLAEQASSPKQLSDTLKKSLTKKYLDLAQDQQSLEQHQLAIELYSQVLGYAPENLEALQGRAKSFHSLGETEKADADRASVRQIQSRGHL